MKKLLLTSILSVVMCVSLIAGATFALFTSESKVNIAVSSGTVKVTATIDDAVTTGSTLGTPNASFKAQVNGANVSFEGMVPGDYAEFMIKIVNGSDVDTVSRTIVQPVADNGLLAGLKISIDDEDFIGYAVTDWSHDLTEKEVKIKIELPKEAGNVYQGKTCKLLFKVEMEQGNSPAVYNGLKTDDNGNVLITNENDWRYFAAMTNSGISTFNANKLNVLLTNDIDFNGAAILPVGISGASFNGHFDGQGNTLKNATITSSAHAALFGLVANGNYIENVKIDNFTISGNHYVGGILGYGYAGVKNCTVTKSTITATPELMADGQTYDNGDKVGGIAGWTDNHEISGNTVKDTVLMGYRDIGGIAGCVVAENKNVNVINNTVSGVTVKYYTEISADKMFDNNTNKNAGAVVGRITGDYETIVKENTISNTTIYNVEGATSSTVAMNNGGKVTVSDDVIDGAINNTGSVTVNDSDINGTITNTGSATVNGGTIDVSGSNAIYNEGNAELKDVTVNMTGNTGYITNSRTEGSVTVYENVTATSSGGGVNVHQGEAEFRSGTITTNSTSTSARHMFYVADGAKLTIEDGEFFFNPTNLTRKGSYICAQANATVIVNGGTFHKPSTKTAPIQELDGATVLIYGGRFAFDPSEFVADGCEAIKGDDGWWFVVRNDNKVNSGVTYDDFAKLMVDGGNIYIAENITIENPENSRFTEFSIDKNINIYAGEGATLTFSETTTFVGNGTLTIYSGAIFEEQELCIADNATLVFEGGTHTFNALSVSGNGKIVVNGGTLNCMGSYAGIMGITFGENGSLIVNDGKLNMHDSFNLNQNRCDAAYVEINGGTIELLEYKPNNFTDNLFVVRNVMDKDTKSGVSRGSKIRINGGTFIAHYEIDSSNDANGFIRNGDSPADGNKVLVSNADGYDCVVTGGTFYGSWQRADNTRYVNGEGGYSDGEFVENSIAGFVADGYQIIGDATIGYVVSANK